MNVILGIYSSFLVGNINDFHGLVGLQFDISRCLIVPKLDRSGDKYPFEPLDVKSQLEGIDMDTK